jgi:hypothetical protein
MRWALYFAPQTQSALWRFGSSWLGRDAVTDAELAQPPIANCRPQRLREITSKARRYGFHATLRAPFRLADDSTEAALRDACARFAQSKRTINLGKLEVRALGDFLALQPATVPTGLRDWVFPSHRHSESAQKLAVSSDTSSSIFFWLLYLPLGSSSLFFTQFQAQCLLVVANETLLAAPATAIPKPAVFGDFHAAGDSSTTCVISTASRCPLPRRKLNAAARY